MAGIIEFSKLPKQALVFACLQYKSFENTLGKGEIAGNFQRFYHMLYEEIAHKFFFCMR